MNSNIYRKVKPDFPGPWEEEIERLKHDIDVTEKKIIMNEQWRFTDKAKFARGCDISDAAGRKLPPEPQWASPRARPPDSSFEIDCGSSVISLDFGLISPKKTWCSPPQRIERAQNREWCSPHRVIDRPNPENSPGNWISMKESRAPVQHSPTPADSACFPRSASQATYTLPEPPQASGGAKRKTSVLMDYDPERVAPKKRTEVAEGGEKPRRVTDSNGHVVKISPLEDFAAPVFGKVHGEEAAGEQAQAKAQVTSKRSKLLSSPEKKSPAPATKKKKKEGGTDVRTKSSTEKETADEKREGEEEKGAEDLGSDTQKMIMDLKNILRGPEMETAKEGTSPAAEKKKEEGPKEKKAKAGPAKATEERQEKRKRNVDPKAVQEYIKSQKQKRMEQAKTEKKTKDAEKEARKKKLEELRIKTLKLATHSKKKKPPEKSIKVVEPGTEDDVTMSLGLKQTKPKLSYNESISKLKKKPTPQKPQEEPAEKAEEEQQDQGEESPEKEEAAEPETKLEADELKKPEETIEMKPPCGDLNATLKKLAETLHLKIEEKEKRLRSRTMSLASKSVKDSLSQVPSRESIRTARSEPGKNHRQVVTVDLDTIQSLKDDIRKISENFKVLHEIIVDKAGELPRKKPSPGRQEEEAVAAAATAVEIEEVEDRDPIPEWLKTVTPRPHPYNVLTAFRHKMNVKTSVTSDESSTFAERISNKYDSDFEELSVPGDRLRSAKGFGSYGEDTSEENYYTLKEDTGSVLSSSILDSEKQSVTSADLNEFPKSDSKTSLSSSVITEITSRSARAATSGKPSTGRENMILVTPDIKLISNDLHQEKLNNCAKNLNLLRDSPKNSHEGVVIEELNNSQKEHKSESTITEIIDNLSENDRSSKSVKSVNEKPQNSVQRVDAEVHMRRSFFQPEILHLQFQAELTLLETFQKSLSHFLEAERLKTLSEVNKIVYEKAINTEKPVEKEDQAVQTNKETSTDEDTNSVKTEINLSGVEETEVRSSSSKETVDDEERPPRELETLDFSNGHTGISFQMLNRMMKDEELRSEHQLALIRLREKTLTEKVKAELTFLEMKKRALKERGGDEEVSAIKKKQRGILLKYQSEKEEIERLKKMHKIASEERRIMIKQQRQIQQMQISTKDMIIKLKKGERSPQRKSPLKPKALQSHSSQSEIQEDIEGVVSDSILTESTSELELSSRSEVSEGFKRTTASRNYKPKKSLAEVEKYPRKRPSVEELLSWTRRLEEKENRLKELEQETLEAATTVKNKLGKAPKAGKISMRDRSTSPFQFQETGKTSEISGNEPTEGKKSSTISEAIASSSKATDTTEKTESVPEKLPSSASEDIPEVFSKKTPQASTSRTTEYNSESFESPSSSEAPKTKAETPAKATGSRKGIAIKMSLSPRMQSPRRRYSSGSDDSLNLSHTETASEQSDLETRIAALHEQLRKRKLEAERLRREQKKAQRERLKVKEQSLLKQIQAYDAYIQKKKQELEQEYEHSTQAVMKPLIKQPKVAEKATLKRQEPAQWSDNASTKSAKSDNEITEQIKDAEESEQAEEEATESIPEAESSAVKSTSLSESLPEQEGSQSESEEQSISVKTTLHSPEKPETGGGQSEESQTKQTIDEDAYQLDSFESDPEEKTKASEEDRKQSPAEEAEEAAEGAGDREQKAGKIADCLIVDLILESLKTFAAKKAEAERKLAEESKLSLEALSSFLAREIIAEAVDDILRIYSRKAAPGQGQEAAASSPERVTSEVRRRITEIMSQAGGVREQRRPQEMMVTTYDVSPPGEGATDAADRHQFLESLTHPGSEEGPEEKVFQEDGSQQEKAETLGQEWFEDDFGLSRTRREAEELRLQQLQIEQEIQQLQAQQEVPYFYLREIPNKPPPPYTPPGKPLTEIPTSESDIVAITSTAVRILTEEMGKGSRVADVEPTWDYYGDAVSEHVKCYKLFLFDLAKQIIADVIEQQEKKEEALPWLRTRERLSRYKYRKIERTLECLNDHVQKQVLILFGFGRKMAKESLIVRWVKKKRDHVDEILVGESQEEEAQWTQYDEDQVAVKNEVTAAILDGLLEDTARALAAVFASKKKREKRK